MAHNDVQPAPDHILNGIGLAVLGYENVNSSQHYALMANVQLQLHYHICSEEERCAIRPATGGIWGRFMSTKKLIDSGLIDRIWDVRITKEIEGEWDRQDLTNLASKLDRPMIQLRPFLPGNVPQPLATLLQMEMVGISWCQANLNETDLNFTGSLPNCGKLESISAEELLQLAEHIDGTKIKQVELSALKKKETAKICKLFPNLTTLDIGAVNNLENLKFLTSLKCLKSLVVWTSYDSDVTKLFAGVKLPLLTHCDISSFWADVDGVQLLFTSMSAAMPKLNRLDYRLTTRADDEKPNKLGQLISAIFQFCLATVKTFQLNITFFDGELPHRILPISLWKSQMETIFTAVLTSKLDEVRVETPVKPTGCDLATQPFQFKKSRNGEQIEVIRETPCEGLKHFYVLKKKSGEICTLEVIYETDDFICDKSDADDDESVDED